MAVNPEEFRSGGVLPLGPVSAWPLERNQALMREAASGKPASPEPLEKERSRTVKAGTLGMARNLAKTARQAVFNGKVSEEIREERMDTCRSCPAFIEDSKRCSDCGCFMEAKSWVGGDPKQLCPQKKWSR